MAQGIRFSEDIEPLVHFIEETPPEKIVEETTAKLLEGAPEDQMMTALTLAVIRSTEMPFVHHGGPLHPVAALHSIRHTMARLPEKERLLPLVQDVALANAHIHDAASGPYVMPEIDPVGEGSVEATREAFYGCLRRNYPNAAEHYFLWLLDHAPREVALEALVRVAVDNYRFDEHKLIAAVNSIRLLDHLGWELAPILLRPVVRYNFMPSVWADPPPADRVEKLVRERVPSEVRVDGNAEDSVIESLRQDLLSHPLEELDEVVAGALSGGLSLMGATDAISLAASEVFARSESTNPMGIHAMTGANALRWVCREFPALGARGLLLWTLGPETQSGLDLDSLSKPDDSSSIEEIREAIVLNDANGAVDRTRAYCGAGGDTDRLVTELGLWAARDSATEMHGMKHHQGMVEEFHETRGPNASMHLVAQAREAALHARQDTTVLDRASDRLNLERV